MGGEIIEFYVTETPNQIDWVFLLHKKCSAYDRDYRFLSLICSELSRFCDFFKPSNKYS